MLRPDYHLSHRPSYLAQIATNCIQTLYFKIKGNYMHRHHPLSRMELMLCSHSASSYDGQELHFSGKAELPVMLTDTSF